LENLAVIIENVSKKFKLNGPRDIFTLIKKKSNSEHNKSIQALSGISFTVEKGKILGIIGANGSGKSTLLRIIAGVYHPDTGSVKVNGRISALMQLGAGFQPDLNARENIIMNGMLLGLSKSTIEEKVDEIIEYAELGKFTNMKLKHFSSGMQARLGFTTAMQIDPDILLVDEILSVGDKNFRKKSLETFLSFKKRKKTILYATHNLEKLIDFSDIVLLLDKGKNVMIGTPAEVIKKYRET